MVAPTKLKIARKSVLAKISLQCSTRIIRTPAHVPIYTFPTERERPTERGHSRRNANARRNADTPDGTRTLPTERERVNSSPTERRRFHTYVFTSPTEREHWTERVRCAYYTHSGQRSRPGGRPVEAGVTADTVPPEDADRHGSITLANAVLPQRIRSAIADTIQL